MSRATVLIVDDERNILATLKRALELESFTVLTAQSGAECIESFGKYAPDVVLLDVVMPDLDGIATLERLKKLDDEVPVVMMSGNATIETAVRATKLGASDFVEKPLSTDKILITLHNALKLAHLRRENRELKRLTGAGFEMIGHSAAMRAVFATIQKTAPSNGRVLISGANGTGKELVAQAIHGGSKRSDRPFVKVNCAAIPVELIESELFGHEKGAFTGATSKRKGKFELADGGTLFLDEIGEMSLSAQAKVLRALQEGEIERVGGDAPIAVDVRVVAATNKDLLLEIAAARFREDLYYRLNVVPIAMPSLRERREDIPDLVDHFLTVATRANDKRPMAVEPAAVTLLMQYDWPGNVRELKNSIERLVILAAGDVITEAEVQAAFPGVRETRTNYQRGIALKDMVAAAERDIILEALKANDGQVTRTAAELHLERSHLYKKMRGLGIDPSELKDSGPAS